MVPGAPAQLVVGRLLHAGEPAVVHIREPDRVGEETALRIDALLLALEPEAGDAEPDDGVGLLRREVVPQQGGLSARCDEGGRALQVEFGEHAPQRGDSFRAIENLVRLDVKRMGGQVGGEEHAVAVHDVGPRGRLEDGDAAGDAGACRSADHRHVEGAQHHSAETDSKDHAGSQQADSRTLQTRGRRRLGSGTRSLRPIAAPPASYGQVSHCSSSPPIGSTRAEGPAGRAGSQRTCAACTCSSGRWRSAKAASLDGRVR